MLLLVVRFCLKSFQLSSLWFLKNLNFFLHVSIISFFLFPNSNFFEFSEFSFSEWNFWFSDDNHLTKSESGSMMVRFDTYDWTDSRIGWVRYESLITCRWISCSYLFNFTEQMEIFIEIWAIYTVYLKKIYFKVTEKCRSTIPSRSFVMGMGRYFCAFNKDWIVFSVPRFSSNDWLYWTLLKLTFQAQMSDWAKNEVI